MKAEGLITVNLTEASKMEVFYKILLDKFNFHKDYIIKENKIYLIEEYRGYFHDIYIRDTNELDHCIYEIIKKIR